MSLSLMRFMVKADAKLGFVPYDTLLNKKLEVSYRSIEAAFRRCDSLNQVSAGGTARAQQAQPSVDGKAPATRLLNVYNLSLIHISSPRDATLSRMPSSA